MSFKELYKIISYHSKNGACATMDEFNLSMEQLLKIKNEFIEKSLEIINTIKEL